MHTQPMEAIDREFDGSLWFPTLAEMPAVDHIRACPSIQVTYLDRISDRCLVLDGIASVCCDSDLADSDWHSQFTARASHDASNAPAAVIRVDVISADVWE
jgi:general stress protein 26